MLLDIYTPALERVGVVQEFTSLQWLRRYKRPGEFGLTVRSDSAACALLVAENLVVKGDEAGIIEDITIERDENNVEMYTARGRFLPAYLARRIMATVYMVTATPRNLMRMIVYNETSDSGREIAGFVAEAVDASDTDAEIVYKEAYKNVLEQINALADAYDVGFRVVFDAPDLRFEVYRGLDRTEDQDVNPRAIFSPSFGNLKSPVRELSTVDAKNYAYVRAVYSAEGVTYPTGWTVGTASGAERREMFIDIGDITADSGGTPLTEAQRQAVMESAGRAALIAQVDALAGEIVPNGNLVYKTDYDLGDTVTIRVDDWGLRVNAQITEVNEIYEDDGYKIVPTLGYGVPSYMEQIKRAVK